MTNVCSAACGASTNFCTTTLSSSDASATSLPNTIGDLMVFQCLHVGQTPGLNSSNLAHVYGPLIWDALYSVSSGLYSGCFWETLCIAFDLSSQNVAMDSVARHKTSSTFSWFATEYAN